MTRHYAPSRAPQSEDPEPIDPGYDPSDLNPSRFIELWAPQYGDRVRIHLNGECLIPALQGSTALSIGVTYGHLPQEEGRTGTVLDVTAAPAEFSAIGHRILVSYDHSFFLAGREVLSDYYAVAELEMLERKPA